MKVILTVSTNPIQIHTFDCVSALSQLNQTDFMIQQTFHSDGKTKVLDACVIDVKSIQVITFNE